MEQKVKVSFYEDESKTGESPREGRFLFSEYLFHPPRVGENVIYDFSPVDEEKWAQESLDSNREGSAWARVMVVTSVCHLIRVVSSTTRNQGVVCLVRKAEND